ncbi:MAG: mannose-6-phosphate isomerase, class I [Treponema sp.]|jgi:mannose-6-phosphate isomerase|nr:mannose-6-phosphate isomerase, class I [Treponema sp.]
MPNGTLQLNILGTSFSISADEDPAYLEELLNFYKAALENTKKSTGIKNPLHIAILTGFLLCDELKKNRLPRPAGGAGEDGAAEKLTLDLIARIDRVLDQETARGAGDRIYKLSNQVKHYGWGSPDEIPALLGADNAEGRPWAELWMGVHPGGPSETVDRGTALSLGDLIGADPLRHLGQEVYETFGTLPFLFKVLAAGKPLSLQAHPNREQATRGFERENARGLLPDSPERNYRDPNHKPELVCALGPFTALCGFKRPEEIALGLDEFLRKAPPPLKQGLRPLTESLRQGGGGQGSRQEGAAAALEGFCTALYGLGAEIRDALTAYIPEAEKQYGAEGMLPWREYTEEWRYMAAFARLYPGDPALISPLFLNIVHLKAGEAMYLPAGVLHAYLHGLAVELMANSDNVLRGGLSSKHIDPEELIGILDFSPFNPAILRPPAEGFSENGPSSCFSYPCPSEEFTLSVMKGRGDRSGGPGLAGFGPAGPSIALVTEGQVLVTGEEGKEWTLKKGESAFIPPLAAALRFSGNYTLYLASAGGPALRASALQAPALQAPAVQAPASQASAGVREDPR